MAINQSVQRVDALGKVTGQTLFPGDISPERLLHGKVLFSGQPHARMLSMDVSEAEAVPGVVAVLTAKDVPVNEYGLIMPDQPVLVGLGSSKPNSDISLWEGDQVAFVIAESERTATEAAGKIKIEWQEMPVVGDVFEAKEDKTILHREKGSNILQHYKIRAGDMTAGWAAAEVVIEGEYELPYQEHAYLQPEAGLGFIDEAGRVTVAAAGQWAHEDREQIAHALDLPPDKVRVVYPAIGGAFGGREDLSIQVVLGLAAMRLKEMGIERPIRVIWSREESILGHHKRHRAFIKTRWGATREGKITAVEAEAVMDAGAYAYTSTKVLGNLNLMVAGPYEIPNARIDSYAVYTNNVPGGAFRGFGGPQGAFAAEGQMNRLAAALSMDPVELRLKNVLREGSRLVTQAVMPSGVSIGQVIEQCAAEANWSKPLTERNGSWSSYATLPSDEMALKRGRGFACAFKNVGFSFGFPERCEATIELQGKAEIERAVLRHAGADLGQGAHTVMRQMTAEALNLPIEKVDLDLSDTASSGDSGSSSASRMTWMAGNAIRGAADIALRAWKDEDRPAIGHYRFVPRETQPYDLETGECDPNITYGYVAEVVEVVVDTETGHLHLERVVCANDVGKALNPNLIEGQIEGGVIQAFGYAVMENLQVSDGKIRNPYLSTYLIPGILDIPDKVDSVILEFPDPQGPWGARGMAEMPFMPLAPAITAALHDATGVWFDKLPLTPGEVLRRINSNS